MTPADLYHKYTMSELTDMAERIWADPANRNPEGSLYIYTPKARKKLENIARAITFHIEERRKAAQ